CENILVFPFRLTLKVLLATDYLDMEEIGYILFHTKSEDALDLVIQRIKNFRALPSVKRTAEIDAYRKTEEGQLTLVKAPTAGYYMYLCFSTGLCDRGRVKVNKSRDNQLSAIKLKNKDVVNKLLTKFADVEIYDFKDGWFLWKEYFANPNRLYPPFDVSIQTNSTDEILVTIIKDDPDHRVPGKSGWFQADG
ncbi:MAG: AlwI family type II restriction endonuclease, partial [PVC group bacterium]